MESNSSKPFTILKQKNKVFVHESESDKLIEIENNPLKVSNCINKNFLSQKHKNIVKCHAILGIITIFCKNYLIYVVDNKKIGCLSGHDIFRITQVNFFQLGDDDVHNDNRIKKVLLHLKNFLSFGFYYSLKYDLTLNLQKQHKMKKSDILDNSNEKYFWNFHFYQKFISSRIDPNFYAVMIQGYVNINELQLKNDEKFKIHLISRRSTKNSNYFPFSTGIDEESNVANEIETENIIEFKRYLFSYTQLRGSIPIMFKSQIENNSKIQNFISKDTLHSKMLFLKNLKRILKSYKFIYYLTALSTSNAIQYEILHEFEKIVKTKELVSFVLTKNFDFQYNDINKENEVVKLIDIFKKMFQNFEYFLFDLELNLILSEQKGVIITSCYDTNTITNLIQREIFKAMFDVFIEILSNKYSQILIDEKIINHKLNPINHQIFEIIPHISTLNSNYIVKLYGLSNIDEGKIENSEEFLYYYFMDIASYCTKIDNFSIFVASWNFGGKPIPLNLDILDWLYPEKSNPPCDIYIVGLQEIVDLSAKNVVFESNEIISNLWEKAILDGLSIIDNYHVVIKANLVGVFLIVLVKSKLKDLFSKVISINHKTGFLGTLGNKGNCFVRFNLKNTSFAISCCHLSAGKKRKETRIDEINSILDYKINVSDNEMMSVLNHNIIIIFGDLNFRSDVDNQIARDLINYNKLDILLTFDQLLQNFKKINYDCLDEGQITFNPTYKFDFGTLIYDTSKKNRVPSWCDRILFSKDKLKQISYNSVKIKHSDHLPIYSIFELNIKNTQNSLISVERQSISDFVFNPEKTQLFKIKNIDGNSSFVNKAVKRTSRQYEDLQGKLIFKMEKKYQI